MANDIDAMMRRIDERLAATGQSPTAASIAAVGKPDLIRDIRRKGSISSDRLRLLAQHLGTSEQWLRSGQEEAIPATAPAPPHQQAHHDFQRHYLKPEDEPPTVPVLGSGLGAEITVDDAGVLVKVESVLIFPNEVVDQLRRPFRLVGRPGIYAFYFEGDSMEPKYTPGEPAFVDPNKPPSVMDYVLVQLRAQEGDDETIYTVMAKRLVGRSASHVELEQFNPPKRFKVKREQIARMHRILQPSDIYSV